MREQLVEIAAYFGLGEILHFRKAGGHAGENFFIVTAQGSYLVKILLAGSDAASADADSSRQILPYMHRMREHGFRIIPYLPAPDGSYLYINEKCRATVQEKLAAASPPELTDGMIAQMGAEQARLHLVPCDDLPQRMTWMDTQYLRSAAAIMRYHYLDREGVPELAALAAATAIDWNALPQSILHGDATADNTLFRGADLAAFIDWDDVCHGASVLDFGMTVAGCCFDDEHGFDRNLYSALLAGYESVRPFSRQERAMLTSAVRRAGVSSAVWQFLKWNHYEPSDSPDETYLAFWSEGLHQWEAP